MEEELKEIKNFKEENKTLKEECLTAKHNKKIKRVILKITRVRKP